MQNEGMLLASNTIFFRVHTRVMLTLFVAMSVVVLCVTGSMRQPPAPVAIAQCTPVAAEQTATPLKQTHTALPRAAARLFFLLPHLVAQDK
jgi:hypothetical protein